MFFVINPSLIQLTVCSTLASRKTFLIVGVFQDRVAINDERLKLAPKLKQLTDAWKFTLKDVDFKAMCGLTSINHLDTLHLLMSRISDSHRHVSLRVAPWSISEKARRCQYGHPKLQ